jgi:hypothetical protein
MHPDTPSAGPPTRLRLVDVRVAPGRGLHLGGQLAGILAETRDRSAAAHWLSSIVVGPRPPGADGSVEVGGDLVSVHTLAEPMLSPGQPRVIDQGLLWTQWRSSCARHRDELAASHASHRLERYRIEAALERARNRPVVAAPRPEPAPEITSAPPAPVGPEPGVEAEPAPEGRQAEDRPAEDRGPEDQAPLREQLRELLEELETLPAGQLPEGELLAEAWEAHAALVRLRDAVEPVPSADVAAIEHRVDTARAIVAETSAGVPDDARVQIEACHRAVVESEAALFAAKRRHRTRAITNYEHAVAAELVTLADAGLDSHASFLLAIDEGAAAANAAKRRRAQAELEESRAELDEVLQIPDMPTRAELEEREALMRTRAAELLGREPGADPGGELRALLVPTEDRVEVLEEITEALRAADVVVTGDPAYCARVFLASTAGRAPAAVGGGPPAAPEPPRPVGVAPVAAPAASARMADIETLEQQRFAHDRALEQLDTELSAIDAVYNADFRYLPAHELTRAVHVLLDLYRAGQLLDGRLPLVLDGALDGLGAPGREAAVQALAQAVDLQTIVVSDDVEVMQSVALAGGTLVRWPQLHDGDHDPSKLRSAPTAGA